MTSPTTETADPKLDAAVTAPLADLERFMADYLDGVGLPANLDAAVRSALLGGGKRLRPVLAIHCCHAVGGGAPAAMVPATATEMIHAFSLVHDDLPALDDDDMRRGKPTLHVEHGEAMAILAGDALMSLAFQVLAERGPDASTAGRLATELALGTTGMIAGQVYDTLGGFPDGLDDEARLRLIHRNKTGALIRAACRMGAISGGADDADLDAVTIYGEAIGLMFQIVDDLLDVEQSSEHLGKRSSKDLDAGKLTFPGLIGVERSRHEIERLARAAEDACARFGPAGSRLVEICRYMKVRTR